MNKTMTIAKVITNYSSKNINICTKVMEISLINNIHLKALVIIIIILLKETIIVTPLMATITIITTQGAVLTCRIIQIIISKMSEGLTHLPFPLIRMIDSRTSLLIKITKCSSR